MVYCYQAINFQEALMKTKHLAMTALMTALLGASATGFAQDRDHGDRDRDRGGWGQHDRGGDRHDDRRDDRRDDRYDGRRDGYQAQGGGRYGDEGSGGYRHWDGAGPNHDIRRGGRLPDRYRTNQYVVNDYRSHHLRQPPRGYHWVQTGGDYVLAAVATGIIADLIVNSH
jgi:Ni/Co efflux regulator RcnB